MEMTWRAWTDSKVLAYHLETMVMMEYESLEVLNAALE